HCYLHAFHPPHLFHPFLHRIPPPPTPTLFPYTTLFRSVPANEINKKHLAASAGFIKFCPKPPNNCFTNKIAKTLPIIGIHHGTRSEEHTSELQSRFDLVCRLLLEKKKKQERDGTEDT